MKTLSHLIKSALVATAAIASIALLGCSKSNQLETASTHDHQEQGDSAQPDKAAAEQDMQMLKDVNGKEFPLGMAVATYGPVNFNNGPALAVRPEEPWVTVGNIDVQNLAGREDMLQNSIRKHIDNQYSTLHNCYAQALEKTADLSGQMTLRWTIETDGTITKIEITDSDIKDESIETCVNQIIEKMKKHKYSGMGTKKPVIVTHPLIFSRPK